MDKIAAYQQAVMDVMEEFAAPSSTRKPKVEKQIIADFQRNRFQVVRFGWENDDKMVYTTLLHFEIKDGKIWIQQNWTELPVATELMEHGVPKTDIVLGFVPAYARQDTGFAVA